MTDLIEKYNVSVPRYTSYPPVPYWKKEELDQEQWFSECLSVYEQSQSLSLYIHLPYCESLCTYCACNKRITKNHAVEASYIDALIREWQMYKTRFRNKPVIRQIHLGGGTPTFFSAAHLKLLIEAILDGAQIPEDHDFSLEVHPNSTERAHLEVLYELGFRRISIGVQDITTKVLEAINRHQSTEEIRTVCDWARIIGYTSVNFDLIYGLPFQTEQSIRDSIAFVNETRPDRIAFYSYAHVPWKSKNQRAYSEADLPKGMMKSNLYVMGMNLLLNMGYHRLGMDHFCLEGDSLYQAFQAGKMHRNFMGYTHSHTECSIGLGASSISDCWTMYAQNEKNIEAYKLSIYEGKLPIVNWYRLTEQELKIRSIILSLMCKDYVGWDTLLDAGLNFTLLQRRLQELEKDRLLKLTEKGIEVQEAGRLFIRNICAAIDPLCNTTVMDKPVFSAGV